MGVQDISGILVRGRPVATGMVVNAYDRIEVRASGTVNFGGALGPFLSTAGAITAVGDNFPTPPDYPVPEFSKNSLILEVRSSASYNRNLRWSRFYQGGVNRTIVPDDGAGSI